MNVLSVFRILVFHASPNLFAVQMKLDLALRNQVAHPYSHRNLALCKSVVVCAIGIQ